MNSSLFYLFLGMISALFVSYAAKLNSSWNFISESSSERQLTATNAPVNHASLPERSEPISPVSSASESSTLPMLVVVSISPTGSTEPNVQTNPNYPVQVNPSRLTPQGSQYVGTPVNQLTYFNDADHEAMTCNDLPNSAYLRTNPGTNPATILGVVRPGEWVQLTGHAASSEGKLWYEIVSPQLARSVYPGAINRLEPGQQGWIDSCSLFTGQYR
ncbi:MAG: hypothetical protein WBA57_20975 [Elainellaceae cyanobacterium]